MIFSRTSKKQASVTRGSQLTRVSILLAAVVSYTESWSHASGQEDEAWEVSSVVAMVQDSQLEQPVWLLWVGLKNSSDSTRLVCMGGVYIPRPR